MNDIQEYDNQDILKETVDYQLIPNVDKTVETWDIRILTGDFVETVFQFGKIKVNEDNESLSFNFEIVSSPNPDLKEEDYDFQRHVGKILYSILENSFNILKKEGEE